MRRRAGFRNRELLSKKTGLSVGYIKMLETGRRRPTRNSLVWLAQACNCTEEEFGRLEADAFGLIGRLSPNFEAARGIPGYEKEMQALRYHMYLEIERREDIFRRNYCLAIDQFLGHLPRRSQEALKNTSGRRPLVHPEVAGLLGQIYVMLKNYARKEEQANSGK